MWDPSGLDTPGRGGRWAMLISVPFDRRHVGVEGGRCPLPFCEAQRLPHRGEQTQHG